ncbi:MAG: hypothetical protein AB1724_06215 [Thermodesulfobacteriota bacterium]
MRATISRLIWLLIGITGAHAGHYLYQRYATGNAAVGQVSGSIAVAWGEVMKLLPQLMASVAALLVSSGFLLLLIITLLIVTAAAFIWFRKYTKIKNDQQYTAKIKEAEAVLAVARTKAAEELQRIKAAEEKLKASFEKKESVLQQEAAEKMEEYVARIKKLEQERLELRELNGSLMSRLKNQ